MSEGVTITHLKYLLIIVLLCSFTAKVHADEVLDIIDKEFPEAVKYEKAKEYLARKYDAPLWLAEKIIKCESGNKPHARNVNKDGSVDYSFFQVNGKYHREAAKKMGYDITDPMDNLGYGFYLWKSQSLQPWSASKKCWSA